MLNTIFIKHDASDPVLLAASQDQLHRSDRARNSPLWPELHIPHLAGGHVKVCTHLIILFLVIPRGRGLTRCSSRRATRHGPVYLYEMVRDAFEAGGVPFLHIRRRAPPILNEEQTRCRLDSVKSSGYIERKISSLSTPT